MGKKIVIARTPIAEKECLSMIMFGENGAEELYLFPEQHRRILGNIYVGKVDKIMENIGAAFIRIAPDLQVYFPLTDCGKAIYKTRKKNNTLRPGDELLIQIDKEALKSKLPRATSNLRLAGKYLVLTTGNHSFSFSRRLTGLEKEAIKSKLPKGARPFGIIVRTNAREAKAEEICEELLCLEEKLGQICSRGVTRNFGSCLFYAPPDWIQELSRVPRRDLSRIVTDDPEVLDCMTDYLSGTESISPEFYQDRLLPLYKLYSVESLLQSLLHEKVWLKSGGSLVIQQTEAFAAIDVNTGKYDGKKNEEETVNMINREAAQEAARQIRLRQLSGVILIDFINMKQEAFRKELLAEMRRLTAIDPVKTTIVDITALDIMEITRQKGRRSLKEQFLLLKASAGKENFDGANII